MRAPTASRPRPRAARPARARDAARLALGLAAGALALGACGERAAVPRAEAAPAARGTARPARERPARNPERNLYFGDLHLHTAYSTDAFLFNTRTTPDDSYRFAKGEEIEYMGKRVRRKAPLDFLAVTDHAEYLGVVQMASKPGSPLEKTKWGAWLASNTVEGSTAAYTELLKASGDNAKIPEFENPTLMKQAWDEYVAFAEKHNDPGRFTAFVAFEWSAAPGNQNLHRNIIFRGDGPERPFSSKDSNDPERLWDYLDAQRAKGLRMLTIPHNGNASNGLMFNGETTLAGVPVSREYLQRRAAQERLTEIMQGKGQSETHPALSPNDEFANFEIWRYLIGADRLAKYQTGSYVRQALGKGQELQEKFGVNPFKLGFVGGTDYHSALTSNEEFNYPGTHGVQDSGKVTTLKMTSSSVGESPVSLSAAGLTGIWAEENTREALWDALERRETFGTSGPRIRVRFFGGWSYTRKMVSRPDWVPDAYRTGVPMGGDLPQGPAGAAPTFIVHAVKDPDSGNLDRLQIVKVATRNGKSTERVFDVTWAGNRGRDPKTGKVAAIGSTVDVTKATYTNTIGATELIGVWRDPAFDPKAKVTYYARVLEIPTPRWSTYWSAETGLPLNANVSPSIQERAWTSPIWYVARTGTAAAARGAR